MKNQRVICNHLDTIPEVTAWLDGLIGNVLDSGEIVTGIIHFNSVAIKGDDYDYYGVVALVNTKIDDAPAATYPDKAFEPWH